MTIAPLRRRDESCRNKNMKDLEPEWTNFIKFALNITLSLKYQYFTDTNALLALSGTNNDINASHIKTSSVKSVIVLI